MKVPFEWLKEYIDTKKSASEIAKSFTALGLMLDKPITTYTNGTFSTEVLDLEHRMDRSDWLSLLGCARDLAAFENIALKKPTQYTQSGKKLPPHEIVVIKVECPDLVHRFNTRVFKNIQVKPSPQWLKNRLESYGIPSINNIVDITNYVMVELGQPMHAQDIKKMEKREIVIRRARKGETIKTLLGETITLDENVFVLTQNDTPTVIGGIVGGAATGIDESTTEIVLDAGNYDQTNIRKTSRRLKIQNETVLRYDKFLHPALTQTAIERATKLILDLAGGEYYENTDWYPKPWPTKKMNLTLARVEKISGISLEITQIKHVLERLDYKIVLETKTSIEVEVPYFRTDVEVEDDLVADIMRMYDYSKIPLQQLNAAPPKDITPAIYNFEDKLRTICEKLGMHEHITDPLVTATGEQKQVVLENAQSQLKNAMRINMLDGLKNVAKSYNKHKKQSFKLFEIGKNYFKVGNTNSLEDFVETRNTQIYLVQKDASVNRTSFETRKVLDGILKELGITNYALVETAIGIATIEIATKKCGKLSWDNIELDNEALLKQAKNMSRVVTYFEDNYTDDVSLDITKETRLGMVVEKIKKLSSDIIDVEVLPESIIEKSATHKNIVFRITHTSKSFEKIRDTILALK